MTDFRGKRQLTCVNPEMIQMLEISNNCKCCYEVNTLEINGKVDIFSLEVKIRTKWTEKCNI